MSRYLIVTAISFTAFNTVALSSLSAEQTRPQTAIEVAQAPDGPAPDQQAEPPAAPPEQQAQPPGRTARPCRAKRRRSRQASRGPWPR
jgi:hypothetical protein